MLRDRTLERGAAEVGGGGADWKEVLHIKVAACANEFRTVCVASALQKHGCVSVMVCPHDRQGFFCSKGEVVVL